MAYWYDILKKLVKSGTPVQIKRNIPGRPLPVQPRVNTTSPFKFSMNDAANVNLVKNVVPPPALVAPQYSVVGYQGGGYEPSTIQGQAAQVHTVVTNTINGLNTVADSHLTKWTATKSLLIVPRAGRMLNAYYDRRSLSFFYDRDRVTGRDVFAADSHDIVAHELGHAILDSYRPDFWNVASMEAWAYHEAFADTISMLATMMYDEVMQYALDETHGDLRQNNVICSLAEQFGRTVFDNKEGAASGWLRNMNNTFFYADPVSLKYEGGDDVLTSEPHNFSRVMSGRLLRHPGFDLPERMGPGHCSTNRPSQCPQHLGDVPHEGHPSHRRIDQVL